MFAFEFRRYSKILRAAVEMRSPELRNSKAPCVCVKKQKLYKIEQLSDNGISVCVCV